MTTRLGRIAFVALVTLVAMVGFLFSPRVPHGQENGNCVSVTDLGPMHIHKNCDSEEFQYIAAHPGLMLSTRPTRQNRPLFALMGWALARPLRILGLQSIRRCASLCSLLVCGSRPLVLSEKKGNLFNYL